MDHEVDEVGELDVVGREEIELVETVHGGVCLLRSFRNVLVIGDDVHRFLRVSNLSEFDEFGANGSVVCGCEEEELGMGDTSRFEQRHDFVDFGFY